VEVKQGKRIDRLSIDEAFTQPKKKKGECPFLTKVLKFPLKE